MARGREYEEWGKEGRREKGGRGRKKEISSERDAPSSQRSESASSIHRPYTIVFTRSRPFHPSSFRFTREDQQDSFAHTWLLRPRTSSSSPPRARKRITTPFGKKKRKGTHGQLISQRSIREQSDSSGSHRHQLPTFPDSRREIRSRNISSFGSSRCYLLHPTWRPPLVPLRIISHGREPLSPPMILDR